MMKNIFKISGIILITLLICSCEEKATPPALTTTAVTEISTTTAKSGGVITDNGRATITERGVCRDTLEKPTIENSKITAIWDSVSLSFTCNLSGLSPNTLYYVRAYATNDMGTGYGNPESFTTLGDKPSANALDASDIQVYSATLRWYCKSGLAVCLS